MKEKPEAGAVILGGDFLGLGIIRCLSEHQIPCFLVDYEFSISRFSRYLKGQTADPRLLEPGYFTDYLIGVANKYNLKDWVLYPTTDEMIKLISMDRHRLEQWYRIPVPSWDVVKQFYYKENAYRIADSVSISIPKMYNHSALDDLLNCNVSYPLVLKPSSKEDYYAKTKRKAVRVDDRHQLIEEYTSMTALIDPSRIVVQEMIGGGPRNLYSYVTFFDGQRSLGGMTARRLRQHPMDFGHATTYAESVDIPEIVELGDRLLRKMEYWGVAEVEFMRDEKANVYKFIEINGRFWGWHTLARAAGINFPQIVYNFMHGVRNSVSSPVIGVKWIRAITDIPTVAKEMMCGRLSVQDYIGTIRGKKEFAVFSIKDPLPAFVEIAIWPYLWVKRGF